MTGLRTVKTTLLRTEEEAELVPPWSKLMTGLVELASGFSE